jgi:hypothetical protein
MTLAALAALAGGCRGDSGPPPAPQGYLFEKGPYQGFYNPQGRLMRLLYDQNGDRKADVVMIFHPNGAIASAEADTDHDGAVDRWQYYTTRGVLEKEGHARKTKGKPDVWQFADANGLLVRRELDEDGDGTVDRTETFQNGRISAVGIDSDRDGKIERWQTWQGGRVTSEELDLDADGIPDRRLRYGAAGALLGVEAMPPTSRRAGS